MAEPSPKKMAHSTTATLNNGVVMPLLGLGTWKSPLGQTGTAVKAAIAAGVRLIDTANDYGNEAEIGQALAEVFAQGTIKREDLFIQSKLWNSNHKKEHVILDLKATLEDLGVGYIDSFVIHWPQACPANGRNPGLCRPPFQNKPAHDSEGGLNMFPIDDATGTYCSDTETHYVETWKAMEDLVDAGLVKSIGISNFNSAQIKEILSIARIKPAVLQNECHPYLQQKDLVDLCKIHGILFQAYSPLASLDSPFRKPTDPKLLDEPLVTALAEKYHKTPAQVVLRWHMDRGVGAVPKSVTPSRIAANYNVFDFSLTTEEIESFSVLNKGWRFCQWSASSLHPDYPFKDELGFAYIPEQAPLNTSKSSLE